MEAAAVSAVVSMTLKVVSNKLGPLLVREYCNIVGVKKDLRELRDQVEDINSWLETRDEAIWNDRDPSFNWLKRMKDVAYDVDDVVDEFQLQAEKIEAADGGGLISKYMFTKPKSFILECKAASKIKTIRKRFAAILKQRSDFITITNSLHVGHSARHMNETIFEMSSLPIVDVASVLGRDQEKDKITTELVKSNGQQERAIISITGLGGSGKTTLAKLIFCDTETIKKHFEHTLWVHVSQEFNVVKLIEKLFEAVTKEKSDRYPLQHISEEISKRLNGKKFLLVLDDVWTGEEIEWEQFMVHLKSGAPESKILVTTRSRRVAEAVESIYIFDLPFLSFDDSWQLFHHSFGAGATGLSPEFQEVGKEIVRKCGGVPLAIKSLAGVLRGMERRMDDWQAMKNNNLLNVQGEEHRVAACLRLSYSHLQYNLKQCFTICSVFPKGHKIGKEQLIDLWIAHDMISMDYIGNKHFNSLVQISFLQNVEEEADGRVTCRMHDLVHDLAQLILGDEISLIMPMEEENSIKSCRYFSLRERPEVIFPKKFFRKARVIYITRCHDVTFGMALEKAKHLRSVIVGSPYSVPNAMFQIKYLKYLSISGHFEELPDSISDVWSLQALYITDSLYLLGLPESIGKLKKLRTLNLSGCQHLNRLPDSIGDCHMISNIDLRGCIDLTVLPNTIGRNKELRVLRLGCTGLTRLPSIITLEKLECLDVTRCYALAELPEGIWNMKKLAVYIERCAMFGSPLVLNRLGLDRVQYMRIFVVGRGKRSALRLHHARIPDRYKKDQSLFAHAYVMEPDDAQMACLKQMTNLQGLNLRRMALEFIKALDDLEPPSGIEELGIRGYSGAHDMAMVNNEFVKAVLDDLEPPSGIKELGIRGYSGRQCAWWMQNQVGGGVQGPSPFPYLRAMNLSDFPKLKHLCGLVELPCLEELEVLRMPSLESISGGPFPSLVRLEMGDLPCLGEVSMVPEGTMPDGEEGPVILVGNCLAELVITGCPMLELKLDLPLSLQHLKLSPGHCVGSSLSPSFSHLKNLYLSDVKGVGSEYGWELLQHMMALESLDIINLTELPESLWSLTSLSSLRLDSCCNMGVLPESLGELWSLQELTIESCLRLSSLPQSMGQLSSLQLLTIKGCNALNHLPESIGVLQSLQQLTIQSCPSLSSLPQSMGQLTSLQLLVIESCKALQQLPDCIGGLCSLCKLKIKDLRELSWLPESICHLTTSLQELEICDCPGLTSLPEGIEGLASLEKLWVYECPGIQSLPEGIKGLTALKELRIWCCPDLHRRYERGTGEDWDLISHIRYVSVWQPKVQVASSQ